MTSNHRIAAQQEVWAEVAAMQEAGQTIDGKTIERRIATLASEKYLAELEAAGHAAGVSRLPFDEYYDDDGGF